MKKIILAAIISTTLVMTSIAPAFAEDVQTTQPAQQTAAVTDQTTISTATTTTPEATTTTTAPAQTTTQAADATVVVPDVNPDSPLYFLKSIFEKVQLFLTFNDVEKAKLLDAIAKERLEDLKKLDPATQQTLAEKISTVYADTIKSLNEIAAKEKAEGKPSMEVNAILEKAAERAVEVEAKEEVKQEVKDIIGKAVVQNVDPKVVETLRNKGYGFGKIALVAAIAEKSGKTVDEVVKVLEVQKGIGKTAKELGLKPGELMRAKKDIENNKNEALEAAKQAVKESDQEKIGEDSQEKEHSNKGKGHEKSSQKANSHKNNKGHEDEQDED